MPRTSATKTPAAKSSTARRPVAGKTASPAKKRAMTAKPAAPVKKVSVKATVAPKSDQKAAVKEKSKKIKLVRDSFTMPESEYAVLGEVKKACLKAGIEVKKSQLLRVGVALLRQLDTARLKEILNGLPALKAGRPKKSK